MRQFKIGFTLMEVLLALAIVGIIATIMTPMLVSNVNEKKSEAILSRIKEQIVLGNHNIIQMANMNSQTGSFTDVLAFVSMKDLGEEHDDSPVLKRLPKVIAGYWGVTTVDKTFTTPKEMEDGRDYYYYYAFKNSPGGVAIGKYNLSQDEKNEKDEHKRKTGFEVYIDTNGWNQNPNEIDSDIFVFDLLNDGTLLEKEKVKEEN